MQFNTDNVKALCLGCHLYWWHKHPIQAKEWADNTLGKRRLSKLKKLANTVNKTPWDYETIKDELNNKIGEFYG